MPTLPRAITKLIESFERLPGIGPRTAARLTFYLLHVPQEQLDSFAQAVGNLKKNTMRCAICVNISESNPCSFCGDTQRNQQIVCVVEQPLDILAMERSGAYGGVYHVLHGAISPLNNIGPDDIFIPQLLKRLASSTIEEIILATNPTMEGEATAMYIKDMIQRDGSKVKLTRLAHGLPVGADIEFADGITLSRALEGRREY